MLYDEYQDYEGEYLSSPDLDFGLDLDCSPDSGEIMPPLSSGFSLGLGYDSDLDDCADETDLNFSLGSECDPDPDGPEAEIKAIFDMNNPTTLIAGHVTGQTDPQAAIGPPAPMQPQQPLSP